MNKLLAEMRKDFTEAIEELDVKYDPFSKKFMKALFIGQMWLVADKLLNDDDVQEELDGAKKYLAMYEDTGDVQYKDMATGELKHADILLKKHLSKATGSEREHLTSLNDERTEMLRKIERSVKIE